MAQQQLFSTLPLTKKQLSSLASWRIIDHACRHCFGRLLQRNYSGLSEVRCSECGTKVLGAHTALCCCGIDAGEVGITLECVVNPAITKEVHREILIKEGKKETKPPAPITTIKSRKK